MKYIEISDDTTHVKNILPEFDSTFPNIPITERFSKDFLESCINVPDNIEVETGYIYNKETNTFSKPIENEEGVVEDEKNGGLDNTIL